MIRCVWAAGNNNGMMKRHPIKFIMKKHSTKNSVHKLYTLVTSTRRGFRFFSFCLMILFIIPMFIPIGSSICYFITKIMFNFSMIRIKLFKRVCTLFILLVWSFIKNYKWNILQNVPFCISWIEKIFYHPKFLFCIFKYY